MEYTDKEKSHATVTPWSSVGLITYKRTYARRLNEQDINSATEEFPDTVERVVTATDTQLGVGFTDDEKTRLRTYLLVATRYRDSESTWLG